MVSTPEELALLIQIYLASGHAQEAVDLLLGPKFNAESRVVSQDPQLVTSLLLEALEAAGGSKQTLKACVDLLQKSEHRNDDRIWSLILKCCEKADESM